MKKFFPAFFFKEVRPGAGITLDADQNRLWTSGLFGRSSYSAKDCLFSVSDIKMNTVAALDANSHRILGINYPSLEEAKQDIVEKAKAEKKRSRKRNLPPEKRS